MSIVTQLAEKLNMTDSRRVMGTWIKGMADPSELYLDETEITAGALSASRLALTLPCHHLCCSDRAVVRCCAARARICFSFSWDAGCAAADLKKSVSRVINERGEVRTRACLRCDSQLEDLPISCRLVATAFSAGSGSKCWMRLIH